MNKKENRMAVRQTVEKAVIRDEQNRRIQSAATNPVKEVLKILHTTLRGLEADMLWPSIFVTLMANKIGGLQFGIYRNCQISSRVFHTAVAALPLTKANRSDFE